MKRILQLFASTLLIVFAQTGESSARTLHLSSLTGFQTAQSRLIYALNNLLFYSLIVIDENVQLEESLVVNRKVELIASPEHEVRISARGSAFSLDTLIDIRSEGVRLKGFLIDCKGVVTISCVRISASNTEVVGNHIRNIPVSRIQERRSDFRVGSVQGVYISGDTKGYGLNNVSLINNEIWDVATGIALIGYGTGLEVSNNYIYNYSQRGVYALPSLLSDIVMSNNDFGIPAAVALTKHGRSTGAIRQPVAFQTVNANRHHVLFVGNSFHGTGEPYANYNYKDSPGLNTDGISRASADVFSFHGIVNSYVGRNYVANSGEVCLVVAKSSSDVHVDRNVLTGCDTTGIYVGNSTGTNFYSERITVTNNTVVDFACDYANDHKSDIIGGITIGKTHGVLVKNNNLLSTLLPPAAWSKKTKYKIGDMVSMPFSGSEVSKLSNLKSWHSLDANAFLPGLVFRNSGVVYGNAQQLYAVPQNFQLLSKGSFWNNIEELKFHYLGEQAKALNDSLFSVYKSVTEHTGLLPTYDFGRNWQIVRDCYSGIGILYREGPTLVTQIGNNISNLLWMESVWRSDEWSEGPQFVWTSDK